jgi:Holliday junction resolvase
MRRLAKKDENHRGIVNGLRALGFSVLELHAVGSGCPDILVGWNGRERLLEIKTTDGHKPRGARQAETNERQARFRDAWRGVPVARVTTIEDAIVALQG